MSSGNHTFNGVELGILVHHNYMPLPYHHGTDHGKSPAVKNGYSRLQACDLIERLKTTDEGVPEWTLTEKGRFHVNAMQSLPMPRALTTWTHEPEPN